MSALISSHNAFLWWWLPGSTPYNGGRGEPVLSKQLGAGIVRESLISPCMKQKTDCKMLWQMKLGPRQVLVLLFMHQGLLQMPFEPCDKMVHTILEYHKDCYRCCHRNLLNLILMLKIIRSMAFQLSSELYCKFVLYMHSSYVRVFCKYI